MTEASNGDAGRGLSAVHIRMVSRVALATGLAAGVVLVLALLFAVDSGGAGYAELIQSQTITRKNLGPALLISGLFLVSFTAFVTWLVCLYGSFRVAGPLYRFARNLEIADQTSRLSGIREDDCFQDVSRELRDSVGSLRAHYQQLSELAARAEALLKSPDPQARGELAETINSLKELERRVRLDH